MHLCFSTIIHQVASVIYLYYIHVHRYTQTHRYRINLPLRHSDEAIKSYIQRFLSPPLYNFYPLAPSSVCSQHKPLTFDQLQLCGFFRNVSGLQVAACREKREHVAERKSTECLNFSLPEFFFLTQQQCFLGIFAIEMSSTGLVDEIQLGC